MGGFPKAVPAWGSGPGCLGSLPSTPRSTLYLWRDTPLRGWVSTLLKQSKLQPTSGDFVPLNEHLRAHLQTWGVHVGCPSGGRSLESAMQL